MKTKLLIVAVCISLFFSIIGGFCVSASSENTDRGAEAFEFLRAVGILEEDCVYTPELMINRGMFAKLAVGLSGYGLNEAEDSVFEDIEKSEYKQYINSAYKYGYIAGVDETHFAPDLTITNEQAIKITMSILGYDHMAQEMGGYPSGYMRVASECRILKNISGTSGVLNMRNAMILLYNAMHTDIAKLNSSGKDYEYVITEGETILTKNFDIYTYEGIMDKTAYTDLLVQDSGMKKGMVGIGELAFDINGTNAEDFLGCYVTLYYDASDEQSDYKVVYVEVNKKKTITEVFENTQNILVDGNLVEYYEDGVLLKKMRVSPTASIIKNGKLSTMSIDDIEEIEKGSIELISNDGDKIADVVRVTEYETYIVGGVSESAGIITIQDGTRIEVDSLNDEYDFSILKDNEDISLSEITSENVLLIAASEGKGRNLKKIFVGSNSVRGIVSKKDVDTVTIDTKEYKADRNILDSINVGKSYFCVFDALGYIAYARVENDIVYGYLFNVFEESDGEIGCRIFTENDRWVVIYFNDRVRFNQKGIDKEAACDFLTENLTENWSKMIRYTVDENARFKMIETAQSIAPGSATESTAIEEDLFRKSIMGSALYKSGALSFGGQFFVDGLTKIFLIPSDLNRDKFGVSSVAELVNDKSYSVIAYDVDEYLTAKMLVIMDNVQSVGSSSKMLIVKSGPGGIILNEDDEPVPKLDGYWRGDTVSLPVKIGDDYVSQDDYDGLEKGDIIQFTYDTNGNVISILPHKADDYGNYLYQQKSVMLSCFRTLSG